MLVDTLHPIIRVYMQSLLRRTLSQIRPIHKSKIFRTWWSELGALLLATASFVGIVCLVLPYREKRQQPNWPSTITLNTIISILTVFLRAGLVYATAEALSQQKWLWFRRDRLLSNLPTFDQATRGPLGSLWLLLDPSTWSVVSIFGALLTILAVAIGPFAQQLLSFDGCLLPSQNTFATIPRQAMYLGTGYGVVGPYYDVPPLDMQSSIYAGIYAPRANIVPIACSSGNCSFPAPYRTLGYCSHCEDVSEQLVYTVENVTRGDYHWQEWNYTLPSGTHVVYRDSNMGSTYMISDTNLFVGSNFEVVWWQGPFQEIIACTESERADPFLSWRCQGYGAANCSIDACVRTYSAEVMNNEATETLLSTSSDFGYESMVDVPCLSEEQRRKLVDHGYTVNDTTDMSPYFGTIGTSGGRSYYYVDKNSPSDDDGVVPASCLYQIDLYCRMSISDWLRSVLSGNISQSWRYTEGSDVMHLMYNKSYTSLGWVDSLFRNVSDGITANLRLHGNDTSALVPPMQNVTDIVFAGNQPAMGTVSESDVCVHVRWMWLIYPASLILLTAIFVVYTMLDRSLYKSASGSISHGKARPQVQSRFRPAGVWKCSILPFMFHGLEDTTLRNVDPSRLVSVAEMEDVAKRMKTRLTRAEDGWKFVKVE